MQADLKALRADFADLKETVRGHSPNPNVTTHHDITALKDRVN
jgi:hypothetical protein